MKAISLQELTTLDKIVRHKSIAVVVILRNINSLRRFMKKLKKVVEMY
jgi:hypothetical protein